jgi:hypothetical protein
MCARFFQGNLKERRYLQYLDVDGTIILKHTIKEQGGLVPLRMEEKWLVSSTQDRSFGLHKKRDFIDWLRNC